MGFNDKLWADTGRNTEDIENNQLEFFSDREVPFKDVSKNTGFMVASFTDSSAFTSADRLTPTNDTTNYKFQSNSVKFTAQGAGFCSSNNFTQLSKIGDDKYLTFWLYAYTVDFGGLVIYFFNMDNDYMTCTVLANSVTVGWNLIRINTNTFNVTGGAVPSDDFKFMRVAFSAAVLNSAVSISLMKLYDKQPAKVVFIMDDGWDSQYTLGYPVFKSKGVSAAIALVSDLVGDASRMTLAQFKEVKNKGFDICNHGFDGTSWTSLNIEGVYSSVSRCNQYMLDNDLDNLGRLFAVYPSGDFNSTIINYLKDMGIYGAREISATRKILPLFQHDFYDINGISFGTNLVTNKGYVDDAILKGELLVWYIHEIDAPTAEQLGLIIDYIKEQSIEIVKPSDLFR